jgi:hypothetical protein
MNPTIANYLGGQPASQPAADQPIQPQGTGLQRMQAQVNLPVACSVCGSDWFYEVTLQQYGNMYSASPGGDMNPISTTNRQIRVCICGQPFKPNIGGVRSGRTGNLSVTGVMDSIEKAINTRAQIPGLLTKMAEDVVSRGELMSVISDLMKRIDASETAPAAEMKPASAAARKAAEKAAKAAEAADEAK